MNVEVVKTNAAAGAEIRGVDLAKPIDAASFVTIESALHEHGVIFLRDQQMTPSQQVDFTRRFGEPDFNFNAGNFGIDGSPEIYKISNIIEDGHAIGTRRAGETWHTDMSYAPRPASATMLYAIEVPTLHGLTLGDTAFANATLAWDALPAAMQAQISGLKGVFDFRGRKRSSPVSAENIAQYPPVQHPIVRRHPRTARKSLYVVRDDCTAIVGMDDAAGMALIEALADHIVRPEFIYQHRWREGDVVVWDNCTVQHRAVLDYDLPQRRLMWRTTLKGDVPH
jgi:taurine dioxygenase